MSKVIQTIEKYTYDKQGRLVQKITETIESNNVKVEDLEEEEPFGYVIPMEVIKKLKPRK